MLPALEIGLAKIYLGDCRSVLAALPPKSVQCVVTSPPYFGLRDYNVGGQIGREESPAEYVQSLVEVFAGVWRVLRDDGVLWLNLGDSYAQDSKWGGASGNKNAHSAAGGLPRQRTITGLRDKSLIGIPWRVAFALQDEGWYLRQEVIWAKGNPMPESVRDRPTRSHEQVFLLTKSPRYFYDASAVAEPAVKGASGSTFHLGKTGANGLGRVSTKERVDAETRNRRSVWHINSRPFKEAHFATFPPDLAEVCILAGTSPQACDVCGAAWVRQTVRGDPVQQHWAPGTQEKIHIAQGAHGATSVLNTGFVRPHITTGWAATCSCGGGGGGHCVVLDPFAGAGTVALVASRLGRASIGIELNSDYVDIIGRRLDGVQMEVC